MWTLLGLRSFSSIIGIGIMVSRARLCRTVTGFSLASFGRSCSGAMSSSHHPQTDVQTERTNRTMEEMLRHYVNYRQNNWDEMLPALEHAYNNSINATTRQVPFELLYGQKSLEFKDLLLPSPTTTVESANAFVSRMESLVVDASKSIAQANRSAESCYLFPTVWIL
jgi:hypothetical protein